MYRYPEPKILAGSNHADVGFDYDPDSGRIVAICAIDNLMKGAAGSAVQCLNLMCGLPETPASLSGLHPSSARETPMFVVKVGGSEGIDLDAVAPSAASLWNEGQRLVLVHGARPAPRGREQLGIRPIRHVGFGLYRRRPTGDPHHFRDGLLGEVKRALSSGYRPPAQTPVGLSGLDGAAGGPPQGRHKDRPQGGAWCADDLTGTVDTSRGAAGCCWSTLSAVVTPPAISVDTWPSTWTATGRRAHRLPVGRRAAHHPEHVPGLLRAYPTRVADPRIEAAA